MHTTKLCCILFFSFFAFSVSSQIPDPTGETEWDYCECVDGIQGLLDICPCPPTPPPSGGYGEVPPGFGTPSTKGINGTGGTNWADFWTKAMQAFCEKYPQYCD